MKIAILDDYQNVALKLADWSAVAERADITVFNDHIGDTSAVVDRLRPFDIVCVMRERTPLSGEIIQQLPNLKLIASTGSRNAAIDENAAHERGIALTGTRYWSTPTIEMTWALILSAMRHIAKENRAVRAGGWQASIGQDLAGKTIGILGLGNIGRGVARVALAFGMNVIAWSQNMTAEIATASGAALSSKEELFKQADIVTIHLVLSRRTRGLVGAPDLALMKPTAWLINTSRGPIVEEASLVQSLKAHAIAGAAIDVFDHEPLPSGHPFRTLNNVLGTPHIGYVTEDLYRAFYEDVVANIAAWLDEWSTPNRTRYAPVEN